MICPHCKAQSPRTVGTLPSASFVTRKRACNACGSTWLTTESIDDGSLCPPAITGKHGQAPVTTGEPSPSSSGSGFALSLSGSGSDSGSRRSSGDRRSDEPGTALAVAVPKTPSLHMQVIQQFCAAFFAGRGVDYHVNAADRSQVGRFLSPPKGSGAAPSPALIAELPLIFANFVGTADDFDQKHGLAYLLTKALNRYRAGVKPRPAAPHPKDRAYVEAVQKPFPRRNAP